MDMISAKEEDEEKTFHHQKGRNGAILFRHNTYSLTFFDKIFIIFKFHNTFDPTFFDVIIMIFNFFPTVVCANLLFSKESFRV